MLTINKAKVQNEKKQWIIKTTKTSDSTRIISIPSELADLIRETGYIYKGDEAPELCPACAHPKAHFERKVENY